jgi:predicted nicotinamide N-methyase
VSTTGSPRIICGYPARLERVPLGVPAGNGPGEIELYTVDDLAGRVDTQALLRGDDGVEPPYWALVWLGARAIASRVASGPSLGATDILDVGCGLGLSGLAAAHMGGRVVFSDYAEEALEFSAASCEHNGLADVEIVRCDFTSERLDRRFDTILAADVVYDPACYDALVDFLDEHLAIGGTLLLTESLRADAQRVVKALCARGFSDTKEAMWIDEDGKPERTWLHTLRRRGD